MNIKIGSLWKFAPTKITRYTVEFHPRINRSVNIIISCIFVQLGITKLGNIELNLRFVVSLYRHLPALAIPYKVLLQAVSLRVTHPLVGIYLQALKSCFKYLLLT